MYSTSYSCPTFFFIAITTHASPLGIPRDIYSGVAQNKVNVSCVDVVFR